MNSKSRIQMTSFLAVQCWCVVYQDEQKMVCVPGSSLVSSIQLWLQSFFYLLGLSYMLEKKISRGKKLILATPFPRLWKKSFMSLECCTNWQQEHCFCLGLNRIFNTFCEDAEITYEHSFYSVRCKNHKVWARHSYVRHFCYLNTILQF